MSDLLKQCIEIMMDRPLATVGCAIAAILYVQLMAGPRAR
jgi:hypothetical protein